MRDRVCQRCGVAFRVKRRLMVGAYCSRACMAEAYRDRLQGSSNPNFRDAGRHVCETCRAEFRNYNKTRRYCSVECRDRDPARKRAASKRMAGIPVQIGRPDNNHEEVVGALRDAGVPFFDLSHEGRGVPDLVVHDGANWRLLEIKNPQTCYGRAGLSRLQRVWAKRMGPVQIVHSGREALDAIGFTWAPAKRSAP